MAKLYENYAYILDYLPEGYPNEGLKRSKRSPVAHVLGESYFSLLEVVPKTQLTMHERIFIGKGQRDKITHIKRRLAYSELSPTARAELPYVVEEVVKNNEDAFVKFFNEARPISIRFHQVELLPGVGKKLMQSILNERRKGKFTSFKDIDERVPSMPDPTDMIVRRVLDELQGKDRYTVFAPLRRIDEERK
jgi:putative nucleotide binding protein